MIEEKKTVQGLSGAVRQAWHVMLLQDDAYQLVLEAEKPTRLGFRILLWVLVLAALGTMIGMAFNWLTLPQYNQIQSQLYTTITASSIYKNFAASSPLMAAALTLCYNLFWYMFRMQGYYPTQGTALVSGFNVIISGLFQWLTYAFIIQILSGWFGGRARKGVIWGNMALAFTPLLLSVANVIPGLWVPASLTQAWILATSYRAVRVTYQLSRGRSVAIIILTPILNAILILLALGLGILIGVIAARIIVK